MPDFSITDPFTQVYQALFGVLFAVDSPLLTMVSTGSRLDMSAAGFAEIPKSADCDRLPELILAQDAWAYTTGNSKIVTIVQSYPLRLATSSLRVVPINQLKWSVVRAMEGEEKNLGLDFVRSWTIRQAQDEVPSESRGDEKWMTTAVIAVEMCIPRDLINP